MSSELDSSVKIEPMAVDEPSAVSACSDCTMETPNLKSLAGSLLCEECYVTRRFSEQQGHLTRRKMKGREPTRKSTRNVGKIVYTKPASSSNEPKEGPKQKQEKIKKKLNYKLVPKTPYAYSLPMVTEFTIHNDQYYQVGDIVGLRDIDDGKMYYAQIRGFLKDQYEEKSAVISWLLPSASSPDEGFDPSTYFLGPDEEAPRKLEYMEFIMHAPSDYFYNRRTPYPTATMQPQRGFIWTRLESGITYKKEECEMIASEVPFTKIDERGNEIDTDDEEVFEIAKPSAASLVPSISSLDILAKVCNFVAPTTSTPSS